MLVSRKETPSSVVQSQPGAIAGPTSADSAKKAGGSGQMVLRPTPPPASWQGSSDVSPITDRRNEYLMVRGMEKLRCGLPFPTYPELWIQCYENKTRLLIRTNCFWADETGRDRGVFVEYRLDDRRARRKWWQQSNDYSTFGLWSGRTAIPLIRRMLNAWRLTIRAAPYHRSPELMIFPINGLKNHIGKVAKACGWKVRR